MRFEEYCDNETFRKIYLNKLVSGEIIKASRRYAKTREDFQLDLQQEGWLGAARTRGDTEEAKIIAARAKRSIEAAYRRDYRRRKNEDYAYWVMEDDSGKNRQTKQKIGSDETQYAKDYPWADYDEKDVERFKRNMKRFRKNFSERGHKPPHDTSTVYLEREKNEI